MNIYIYKYIYNKIYRNKQQSDHCVCYSLCTYLVRCQGTEWQVCLFFIVQKTDIFIIYFIIWGGAKKSIVASALALNILIQFRGSL